MWIVGYLLPHAYDLSFPKMLAALPFQLDTSVLSVSVLVIIEPKKQNWSTIVSDSLLIQRQDGVLFVIINTGFFVLLLKPDRSHEALETLHISYSFGTLFAQNVALSANISSQIKTVLVFVFAVR